MNSRIVEQGLPHIEANDSLLIAVTLHADNDEMLSWEAELFNDDKMSERQTEVFHYLGFDETLFYRITRWSTDPIVTRTDKAFLTDENSIT